MKKYVLDLTVRSIEQLSPKHVLLRLTHEQPLPEMLPGQFVEVRVDGSPTTFLRRPISINFVDWAMDSPFKVTKTLRTTCCLLVAVLV